MADNTSVKLNFDTMDGDTAFELLDRRNQINQKENETTVEEEEDVVSKSSTHGLKYVGGWITYRVFDSTSYLHVSMIKFNYFYFQLRFEAGLEKDPWIELVSRGKLLDPTEEVFQWVKLCDIGTEK